MRTRIKVMAIEREPFVIYDKRNEIHHGLGVALLENFAKIINVVLEFENADSMYSFEASRTLSRKFNLT